MFSVLYPGRQTYQLVMVTLLNIDLPKKSIFYDRHTTAILVPNSQFKSRMFFKWLMCVDRRIRGSV